jgi:hypothetical protein
MRDNFSMAVKETLARRVGVRCSNPDGQRPTSGPFECLIEWRPWIEGELGLHWSFLGREDRRALSLALAWEGDAYTERTLPNS